MRRDTLDQNQDYQKHLNTVRLNWDYCNGDKTKHNWGEHYYVLAHRVNEMNTYVGRKFQYASEVDQKMIFRRNMLFHANFTLDFAFLKTEMFDEILENIEEWVLNEKAYFGSEVTVHDNDGIYTIEGLLDTDSEMEDDRYVITKVFDYNLACALEIFLNWFNEETAHYAKFRNFR